MADVKVSDLDAELTPTTDDGLLIIDDLAGTPAGKIVTVSDLLSSTAKNPAAADLDMNGQQIDGLPSTQSAGDQAISKEHLDTAIAPFLISTLTEDLDLDGNQVLGAPAAQTLDDHLISKKHFEDNTVELPTLTALQSWRKNAGNTAIEGYTPYVEPAVLREASLEFIIDGGGTAIPTGEVRGGIQVPFDCTIVRNALLLNSPLSFQCDIWRSTYAALPADVGDSITASAPVKSTGARKTEDVTLTGWTTSLSKGDWLFYNVDSNSGALWAVVVLDVVKV